MTKKELGMLQALPLEVKIMKTMARIEEFVRDNGKDGVYVAYSGGKDSEVLVDLCRKIHPNIQIVFSSTGQEFPEIISHVLKRRSEGYNIKVVVPTMKYKDVVQKYGYPVVSKMQSYYIHQYRTTKSAYIKDLRWNGSIKGYFKISEKWKHLASDSVGFKISSKCCDVLKKNPMKKYEKETGKRPIVGVMAQESMQRTNDYLKNGCNSFNKEGAISKPLGFWREEDIWEYIKQNKLEISECYTKHGMRRTGCYGCLYGCHIEEAKLGTNRIIELKATHPKLYDYLMNHLDYKVVMETVGLKTE
ncbi:MAG: phosphoadenosine phosphosulfate reductase family protein [Cetobacterium sp.]